MGGAPGDAGAGELPRDISSFPPGPFFRTDNGLTGGGRLDPGSRVSERETLRLNAPAEIMRPEPPGDVGDVTGVTLLSEGSVGGRGSGDEKGLGYSEGVP
jgi:hypothetical protein